MEDFKNEGIYAIVNIITNDIYIGSSLNLGSRKDKHFTHLKHNKHSNYKLQSAANEYGIGNFKFKIIEYTSINLKQKEQYYVNQLNPAYNITIEVIRNTPSEESKHKMSITRLRMFRNGLKPNGSKKIVGINIETGEIVEYNSIRECYQAHQMARSALQRTLKGKYKQMKGFKWYYKDNLPDLLKLGELLENPEVDNQQPSL